jgi:3-hydroxyisobutyrate dehydrogenase
MEKGKWKNQNGERGRNGIYRQVTSCDKNCTKANDPQNAAMSTTIGATDAKTFEGGAVGFIGLGVMGRSLAGHLLKAGYSVVIYTRSPAKAEAALAAGAQWAESPADLARRSRLIFTMVGFPADVEEVYLSPEGLIACAAPGTLLVDLTTSTPTLARRIAGAAAARGSAALDVPVTGGDVGARNAQLSLLAGGDVGAFARAEPVLRLFGPTVVLHGPAGSGQHAKMCNQIMIACTMIGLCEALAYGRAAGLDASLLLQSTSGGGAASWSLQKLAPRILSGDFAPGFYVKHFVKDLAIALAAAREMGLALPGLELGEKLYRELAAAGHADDGTQALWKLYESRLPKK